MKRLWKKTETIPGFGKAAPHGMEEPSVLDFVKAKLTFWKKSDLHIPDPDEVPLLKANLEVVEDGKGIEVSSGSAETITSLLQGFPWLIFRSCLLYWVNPWLNRQPANPPLLWYVMS